MKASYSIYLIKSLKNIIKKRCINKKSTKFDKKIVEATKAVFLYLVILLRWVGVITKLILIKKLIHDSDALGY